MKKQTKWFISEAARKFFVGLITLSLVLGLVPTPAIARDNDVTDDVTIEQEGQMASFESNDDAELVVQSDEVENVNDDNESDDANENVVEEVEEQSNEIVEDETNNSNVAAADQGQNNNANDDVVVKDQNQPIVDQQQDEEEETDEESDEQNDSEDEAEDEDKAEDKAEDEELDLMADEDEEEEEGKFTLNANVTSTGLYDLGQTAEFVATITNTSDEALEGIEVWSDEASISAGAGYSISGNKARISSLAAGKSIEIHGEYEVTADDVEEGAFDFLVFAVAGSVAKEIQCASFTVEANPKLSVSKTYSLNKAAGNTYANQAQLGDTINYTIEVENTGNVNVHDIKVADELNGFTWTDGSNGTVGTLAPNGTETLKGSYTVTEDDLSAGDPIVNTAIATGTCKDDSVSGTGRVETPVQAAKPSLFVSKSMTGMTKAEGNVNKLAEVGDTLSYEVTVTNNGNVTVNDIVVIDMIDGFKFDSNGSQTLNEEQNAIVGTLVPGESSTVTGTYVVRTTDMETTRVDNTAMATGMAGDTKVEAEGDTSTPVKSDKSSLFLEKTVLNEKTTYAAGDTVEYQIKVTNNGNATLHDVVVNDSLDGFVWTGVSTNADNEVELGTLTIGQDVVLKGTYTLTEDDMDIADTNDGEFANSAFVTGYTSSEEFTYAGGAAFIQMATPQRALQVRISIDDAASQPSTYMVGETISYTITVTNTGNVVLHDVVVNDELGNAAKGTVVLNSADGAINGSMVTFDTLAAGETKTIKAIYTIARGDVGKRIVNGVSASCPDVSKSDISVSSATRSNPVEKAYTLTVKYVYTNGKTAAPSHKESYLVGEAFDIASPTISGYKASYKRVISDAKGMPAKNVVVTVTYTAKQTHTDDDNGNNNNTNTNTNTNTDANTNTNTNTGTNSQQPASQQSQSAAGATPAQATTTTDITTTAATTAEPVEDDDAPIAQVTTNEEGAVSVETIGPDGNPLAPGKDGLNNPEKNEGTWALVNLLAALLTAAAAIISLLGMSRGSEEDTDSDKRRNTMRLFSLVPAVVAVAAFLLTENLSQPMGMTDKWTLIMMAPLAVQAILMALIMGGSKE